MSGSPPSRPRDPVQALQALNGYGSQTLRRAQWLDVLDRQLRVHLDPTLAAHARLANVDGTRLVFLVDGPVWHARLRLLSPDLLASARSLGLSVDAVIVKTARHPLSADHPAARRTARFMPDMSPATAAALQAALASLRATPPDDVEPE